jgi:hypothetical protein
MAEKRFDDVRDLIAAVEPESSMADLPSIDDSRFFTYASHPVFITERVMPWWSRARDKFLWETLVASDALSSAINVTSARLFSIPVSIAPRDDQNKRNREVSYWSNALLNWSCSHELLPFILDWQTQDNGAFAEILGGGSPDGELEPTNVPGTATWLYGLGIRHLDSQKVTRTGDPEYPVIYEMYDKNGKYRRYKLHRSRVIMTAQMESPRDGMNRVGFCGTSRTIQHVLHLNDISIIKEEWLGSRPISQIIFGRGFTAQQLENAFKIAEEKANAIGNMRYAQSVFLGVNGNPDNIRAAGIDTIPLKRLPEGYDEESSFGIAMNVIAMALGFDARELWPATVRGATRADAEVSHLKTMRKTPGVWTQVIGQLLDEKYAPATCFTAFDRQDDEQDRILGENRKMRADELKVRLESRQIDLRTAYEIMLEAGDIKEPQYKHLLKKLEEDEAKAEEIAAQQTALPTTPMTTTPAQDAAQEEAKDLMKELIASGTIWSANGNGTHERV